MRCLCCGGGGAVFFSSFFLVSLGFFAGVNIWSAGDGAFSVVGDVFSFVSGVGEFPCCVLVADFCCVIVFGVGSSVTYFVGLLFSCGGWYWLSSFCFIWFRLLLGHFLKCYSLPQR